MSKVGAQKAAKLAGVSKSTIQRAMKQGRLSYEIDEQGQKMIDLSELERVFGLNGGKTADQSEARIQAELQRAADMLELERTKMRVRMLEDQLHVAQGQIDDLKDQRDQWQKQAQQVLLTSQHTQKQADDLKQELKAREQRERLLRQKQLEARMRRLQAQNENDNQEQEDQHEGGFWARLFGRG
jgi:hypothetical protein